jgi:DNA-binding CsgD family transcriptional regulator
MAIGFAISTLSTPVAAYLSHSKRSFWVLVSGVLACELICFGAIMAYPSFLHSPLLAFVIGLLVVAILSPWMIAFEAIAKKRFFLCLAYVPAFSVTVLMLVLALPETIHMYAVLIISLVSFVLGIYFVPRFPQRAGISEAISAQKASRPANMIGIIAIAAATGFAYAIIRLLASERLYEDPDTLYLAFCLILFLMTEGMAFVILHQTGSKRLFFHALVVALICLLGISVSLFSWMGHRGLFVFMGLATLFSTSFLFPMLYAWRRSFSLTQTVSASQCGVSLGILLAFLGRTPLITLNLSTEIQIVALAVFVLIFCFVFVVVVLGYQNHRARDGEAPSRTNSADKDASGAPSSESHQDKHDRQFMALLEQKGLTPRQREVTLLAAKGFSVPTIASQLVLSEKTIENHLTHAYHFLGVHKRQELITSYQSLFAPGGETPRATKH